MRATFNGFQTGVDLGVANIEGLGWNAHLGVTAGQVNIRTNDLLVSTISSQTQVPFLGVYGAVTGHNFFADFEVREDFYLMSASNPSAFLNGTVLRRGAGGQWRARLSPQSAIVMVHRALGCFYLFRPAQEFATHEPRCVRQRLPDAGLQSVPSAPSGVRACALAQPLCSTMSGSRCSLSRRAASGMNSRATSRRHSSWPPPRFRSASPGSEPSARSAPASRPGVHTGFTGDLRGDYRVGPNISGYAVVAGLRYQF